MSVPARTASPSLRNTSMESLKALQGRFRNTRGSEQDGVELHCEASPSIFAFISSGGSEGGDEGWQKPSLAHAPNMRAYR